MSSILLVLGMAALLLIAGATVAGQAKYELQMSAAHAEAEQAQFVVLGAINDAMKRAEDPAWPTTPFDGSTNPCIMTGSFPRYCIDALSRSTGAGVLPSIPIRITYQLTASGPVMREYGWIMFTNGAVSKPVTGYRSSRTWCTYQTVWELRNLYGPCVQGG